LSVAKKTFLFTFGTFFSRLLGLVREAVLAAVFGAGNLLDAFFVANRIPNMLREMLAEGALGSSFTQRYSKLRVENPSKAEALIFNMLCLVFCIVGLIVAIGIIFSPEIVGLLTIAADSSRDEFFFSNTIFISRFLFPFILIMSVTAILSGVLHQKGNFFTSAVSPVALNMGYISGALIFATIFDSFYSQQLLSFGVDPKLFGLAFGVMVGGIGQALWQALPILKHLLPKGKISLFNDETKAVLVMMGPMILGASAGQVNVLVNTNFATSLESGAVSWLTLSFRILQLPIGLFGVAIASVILPSLTKKITEGGKNEAVGRELQQAIELVFWLMAPCMVGIVFAGHDIIAALLLGGSFDDYAVSMTGKALSAFGMGVIGYGMIKVLTNYFYATGRTAFPMKVGVISIFLNFTINFLLVEKFGHVGLAYTAAAVFCINALMLCYGIKDDPFRLDKTKILRSLGYAIFAVACSAILCIMYDALYSEILSDAVGNGVGSMKLTAGINLMIKGMIIGIIFLGAGCFYLRSYPAQLVSKARSSLKK